MMKENNLQPRLLYPARISFKYEGEIKSFTDIDPTVSVNPPLPVSSTISSFYGSLLIIQVQGILNFKNEYISPTPKSQFLCSRSPLFFPCFTIKLPRKLSLFAISLPYIPIYPGDQNLAAPLKLLSLRPSLFSSYYSPLLNRV